jgi:prevent-host-death family protein
MKVATKGPALVGVRELRDHLSRYLDEVKRGRHLVVTDHGRRVARLVPADDVPDRLSELIANGRAQAPRCSTRRLPPLVKGAGAVSELVVDQRR